MRSAIKWMAENHVAANILMLVLVAGGLIIGKSIKQEVFPEFEMDMITVSVVYPGASPTDVETGIVLPLENALSGIDNVKRMTASASESVGSIQLEVMEGGDTDEVLDDVKSEVDRIVIFPEDAEKPVVSKVTNRREVMTLAVYGDASERVIFEQAERVRDELLDKENITQVEISAVRSEEISIEISEENLQRYSLTLNQVANIISRASLDLPGGSVRAEGGEILIRTQQKRYYGGEFDSVTVISTPEGDQVKLSEIANVIDGFERGDYWTKFDGKRAALISVYRVGDQTPRGISTTVKNYIEEVSDKLPPTIGLSIWSDRSVILDQRMFLLIKNGAIGVFLVLIILALFLEIRLAFWVAMGMVISFIGAFMFMPSFDVSINMLSLFAFLVVLGIVVDDAIIVGENIFVHIKKKKPFKQAAVDGTVEISRAVTFAILTSVAAFSPLLFTSGTMGKFMRVVPVVVITVLLLSLIESLFILPAHLSGGLVASKAKLWARIENQRRKVDRFIRWWIDVSYVGTLKWVQRNKYTTVAIAVAVMLVTAGFYGGGFIKFVFMPKIDADWIRVTVNMTPGTTFEETEAAVLTIQEKGLKLVEEYEEKYPNRESDLENTFTTVGSAFTRTGSHGRGASLSTNLGQVMMRFKDADERRIDLQQFTREWNKRVGEIPNMDKLTMRAQLMGSGDDIDIQLAHDDYEILLEATERLKFKLSEYGGVTEVNDSYSEGKEEIKLTLKPEAKALGITETDMALQVRSAFYGAEAMRIQRGRNEVRVMVRYPEEDRKTLTSLDQMRLRNASGVEIPLKQAAYIEKGQGYSVISRAERKRVVHVTAKVNARVASPNEILADVTSITLNQMITDYPGLTYDLEGESRNQSESMGSLFQGFLFALFVIYALLAIPFRSFLQPIIVMSAIPFGFVGAVIGHLLLGYNLSMISSMGMIALAGVVVNDSLVMIDFINRNKEEGLSLHDAVLESGKRRFRPIILTSLTTFFGLMPMMLETSIQARFLIPMTISLGFGVLFATAITLVLIPALYLILEDVKRLFGIKEEAIEVS